MDRGMCVVWMALVTNAAACSTEQAQLGTVEAEAKPPKDAAPADSPPPPVDSPPPVDGGGGGGGGSPDFIDACLLPGMTPATFYPTSAFPENDEGVTALLDLPFPFTLHGTSYATYWFTTNGQLGFGGPVGGSVFGGVTCPLPDTRFTTPIVLVYSADLVGRFEAEGGAVCHATTGTAPNRKLVVTWKNSFFYDAWNNSWVTFSATLNEGTNVIDVVIERADAPFNTWFETGEGSVLGTQSGSAASTFSCFQPLAPEGTVIHYNP